MKLPKFLQKLLPGAANKARLTKDFIRCPHCDTLYALYSHVNWDNLVAVHCGTCTNTFNGLENKSKPKNKIKIPKSINPFQARLSSQRQAMTMPGQNLMDAAIPDILAMPRDEKLMNEAIPDILTIPCDEPLAEDEVTHKTRKWGWAVAVVGVLLASNVLVASMAWFNQDLVAQNAFARPWLQSICEYLNCSLPPYHDPSKIIVQQHQLVPDPQDPGHLQLHALIQNTSSFAQSLPTLEVQIDNLKGELVKTLTFKSSEYASSDPSVLLQPGQTLHISVGITETTPDIFSYELRFI